MASHRDILRGPVTIATSRRVAVRCSSVEAPTARCDSRGCPADALPSTSCRRSGSYISSTSLAVQLARVTAAAEGQERGLATVSGIRGPRQRPEGDQG